MLDRLPLWAMAVLVGCVCVQMFPFRWDRPTSHSEITSVLAGIEQARLALREGQFPVRVAPRDNEGNRYPLYQFYGALQFNTAGIVALVTDWPAYRAFKAVTLAMLLVGAICTYRLGWRFTRSPSASAVGVLVFTLSPYMFTDLHARGAVAETYAFNVLPMALFYALRCFDERRWTDVPKVAIAWSLLAMAHNITYLYATTLVAILLLTYTPWRRRSLQGYGLLLVAGLIHAAMIAWYVVPQTMLAKEMVISLNAAPVTSTAWARDLVNWRGLLSPVLRSADGSSTGRLALQIGWPILVGVIAAVGALVFRRLPPNQRGDVIRLAALFALSVFMALAVVDVWQYLPSPYGYIQFPYRMLLFVVMWGALLTTIGWSAWVRDRPTSALPPAPVVAAGMLSLLVASTYVSAMPPLSRAATRELYESGQMGGRNDYLLTSTAVARTTRFHPDADLAGWEWSLSQDWPASTGASAAVPPGADGIIVKGFAFGTGERREQTVVVETMKQLWATRAMPGPFAAEVAFTSSNEPRVTEIRVVASDRPGEMMPRQPAITSVRWRNAPASSLDYVSVDETRPHWQRGRLSSWIGMLERPSLVVFPMIYYPGLLDARVNDQPVAYENMGRLVALELQAGRQDVRMTFRGVSWANGLSLGGWLICLTMLAIASCRPRRMEDGAR